jgi:hypothetical protein
VRWSLRQQASEMGWSCLRLEKPLFVREQLEVRESTLELAVCEQVRGVRRMANSRLVNGEGFEQHGAEWTGARLQRWPQVAVEKADVDGERIAIARQCELIEIGLDQADGQLLRSHGALRAAQTRQGDVDRVDRETLSGHVQRVTASTARQIESGATGDAPDLSS